MKIMVLDRILMAAEKLDSYAIHTISVRNSLFGPYLGLVLRSYHPYRHMWE